jgi:hypothetical protein
MVSGDKKKWTLARDWRMQNINEKLCKPTNRSQLCPQMFSSIVMVANEAASKGKADTHQFISIRTHEHSASPFNSILSLMLATPKNENSSEDTATSVGGCR